MSMRKILKSEGAKNISKNAAKEMSDLVESYSKQLAKKAIKNAFFSGRKTIKRSDVEDILVKKAVF